MLKLVFLLSFSFFFFPRHVITTALLRSLYHSKATIISSWSTGISMSIRNIHISTILNTPGNSDWKVSTSILSVSQILHVIYIRLEKRQHFPEKFCLKNFDDFLEIFVKKKDRSIHLNDKFPLKIANIFLKKQHFPLFEKNHR